ncbi:MAG: WbqC family protein [Deltaproteobacteria bacterium]|nr:WbqC family protein [Deltaproteobacteria bacterium]MDQ3297952.1 WbqC family protein [Myxococcota bacterium]
MIVAAHQPHYLPWLGYLDKVAAADVFVVMDDLQYEDQNFQNRQRMKLNDGPHWLSVPLHRGGQSERICDKRIDNTGRGSRHHWQIKTWRTLVTHYGRAPHFERYAGDLEDIYVRRWTHLLELDLHILECARNWLGITRPIVRASSLALRGAKTERILDFCQKLDAKVYLTGRGGSAGYLDTDLLTRAGVTTTWQSFRHPTYAQRYGHLGFVSHLGFLDLLLNSGPGASAILRQANETSVLSRPGTPS